MGALSKREMTIEADILNPLAMTMGAQLSGVLKQKVLSSLTNETEHRQRSLAMFEESDYMGAERTAHPQIPPASIRVQSVKTRSLKGFDLAVDKVKQKEDELIQKKHARMRESENY